MLIRVLVDLFNHSRATNSNFVPLAHLLRPNDISNFVGQGHLLDEDSPLRQWIRGDNVPSLIFWGPPGCGKTTLAHIIAKITRSRFESLSAVQSGVKDIKNIVEKAKIHGDQKTIVFVDEIHRFNKVQQDALLPHVEDGTLTIIGATTENPSFEINSALLSRVRVLAFQSLESSDIEKLIDRAVCFLKDRKNIDINFSDESKSWLARCADGDARRALTIMESLILDQEQRYNFEELEILRKVVSKSSAQLLRYDKNRDGHYDLSSALIKSLRGSDENAAIYYLARMLEGGEDPKFIARRLVIFASEDVGNADPQALILANAAKDAVLFVGLPECRINLGQITTYLALAPKSNASYQAIDNAIAEVKKSGNLPIPMHLRNAPTKLMKEFGYSDGYEYAHNATNLKPGHEHLPAVGMVNKVFYRPKNIGFEKTLTERIDFFKKEKNKSNPL